MVLFPHPYLRSYTHYNIKTMMVSIICPIYNEERYIDGCIQSVLNQDLPTSGWELLLVDGGSTDRTLTLIEPYKKQYSNIRLLNNPKRTAPYAMNIGIRAAQGEFICRIDAHASYPANYVSTLLHYCQALPQAANVGAPCHTLPRENNQKGRAIAAVLSNRFGVGGSAFRIGVNQVTEVDTAPFGFFPRNIFEQVGMYNESLQRNQDIELNKRIIAHGGKVYLVPDTFCTYYARSTYAELAVNNFGNGKWNILTLYYTHDMHSLSVRHFIPLCFLLSLIVPLCLMPLWRPIGWITVASLILYSLFCLMIAAKEAYRHKVNYLLLIGAFVVLHFSYGIGSLSAIAQLLFIRKK